jgi:sulfite exporter TauE/SafE
MTLYEKATRPHLSVTYCAIGALIGGVGSIYAGRFSAVVGVQGVFIWTGLILMLWYAWAHKPTWPKMLKAQKFWIGISLIVAGNIFWFAFSK